MENDQNSREKGAIAEDLAKKLLIDKGYKIVKTNFHFGNVGEIDIIAKDGNVLVFVEVKSRQSPYFGAPIESLTPKKAKQVRKVAEGYLFVNKISNVECRCDFIGIDLTGKKPDVEHIINAF